MNTPVDSPARPDFNDPLTRQAGEFIHLPQKHASNTPTMGIQVVRNRLVNKIIVYMAFLSLLGIAVSLSRISEYGWNRIYLLYLGLVCLLVGCAILRKRLPYALKAFCVLGILFVVGAAGLLNFGLAGGGSAELVMFALMTAVLFGTRAGLIACAIDIVIVVLVGVAVCTETVTFSFDFSRYAVSPEGWGASIIAFLFYVPVLILAFGATQSHMTASHHDLSEREAQYRLLFESANEAIFLMEDNIFLDCNEATLQMFGCDSKSDIIGHSPSDFSPKTQPDGRDSLQKTLPIIKNVLDGQPQRFEWKQSRKNGSLFDAEVSLNRVVLGEKTYIQAVVRDITDRKQMERERLDNLWFLESMDRINRAIQGTNDLEKMTSDVLDMTLSVFNCDRASLCYPLDPDASSFHVPMERTRPEYPGAFAQGIDVPVSPGFVEMARLLRNTKGAVIVGPGSQHQVPDSAAQMFGIQSLIQMAVYPKTGPVWMFGVQQCSYPRVWTLNEKNLFEAIGRRLEDALTSLLILRDLRESESKLTQAQRIAHIGHWEYDVKSKQFAGSDELFHILGLSRQKHTMNIAQFREIIHPDDRTHVTQAMESAFRGDPPFILECRVVHPDSNVRFIQSQWNVTRNASGQIDRLFGTIQDLTEYKKAQEALRREQELVGRIMETSPVGIIAINRHGEITFANACAEKILGLSRNELTKCTYNAAHWHITDYKGDTFPEEKLPFQQVKSTGLPVYDIRHAIQRTDGQQILLSINAAPVFSPANKFEGMVATVEDVTERVRAQKALQESEMRFHSLFNAMSEGVALHGLVTDKDGKAVDYRIVDINPAYAVHTGLQIEQVRNQLASELYKPGSPPYLELFAHVAQTGAPMFFEAYFPKLGKYFDISVFSPKTDWFATVFTDITLRRKTQQQLRASEEKFMKAFQNNPAVMSITTVSEGRFLEVNEQFLDTLGFRREEVIGKTSLELNIFADYQQRKALVQSLQEKGYVRNYEVTCRTRSGELRYALMSADIIELQNEKFVLVMVVDITDSKNAEDALKENEEKYRALVENSLEGIGISRGQEVLYANRALLNLFGCETLEEFQRIPFLDQIAPESRSHIRSVIECHQQGGGAVLQFEFKIIRKDGEIRELEASSSRVVVGGQNCTQSTVRDITELKKAYEQLHQHQGDMAHLQRVSELGEMASGLAHEINQPLCAIENYAEACLRMMEVKPDSVRLAEAIKDIRDQAERAGKIVHRVKGLVRKKPPQFEFAEIKDILREAVDMLGMETKTRGIQMVLNIPTDLPMVYADFVLIEQVVINLIRNSFDAMSSPEIHKKELTITARAGSNNRVEVAVSDTGLGISRENRDKLFRSFFTTKPGGLGIGLSLCKTIVESHFGQIWADSNADGGATFHFTLPTRSRTDET